MSIYWERKRREVYMCVVFVCVYVWCAINLTCTSPWTYLCAWNYGGQGQLLEIDSLLLPCGFLGWNSGHGAWWKAPGLWNHFTRPTELLKLCSFLFYYFMCLRGFPACFCVPGTYICQKSELGTLELELDICEPPCVFWESNQTFWKSSQSALNYWTIHLSSPILLLFFCFIFKFYSCTYLCSHFL